MINEKLNFFVSFDHTWNKIVNFGQNWSSGAGKLTGCLFSFDGRSEKNESQDDLPNPQVPGPEDFADIAS